MKSNKQKKGWIVRRRKKRKPTISTKSVYQNQGSCIKLKHSIGGGKNGLREEKRNYGVWKGERMERDEEVEEAIAFSLSMAEMAFPSFSFSISLPSLAPTNRLGSLLLLPFYFIHKLINFLIIIENNIAQEMTERSFQFSLIPCSKFLLAAIFTCLWVMLDFD